MAEKLRKVTGVLFWSLIVGPIINFLPDILLGLFMLLWLWPVHFMNAICWLLYKRLSGAKLPYNATFYACILLLTLQLYIVFYYWQVILNYVPIVGLLLNHFWSGWS